MTEQYFDELQEYGKLDEHSKAFITKVRECQSNIAGKIKVKEFYDYFDIKQEDSELLQSMDKSLQCIGEPNESKDYFKGLVLKNLLPKEARNSIDDFFNYEIPKELIKVVDDEIQAIRVALLYEYNEMYNNPKKPNIFDRFLRGVCNTIYDMVAFLSAGGTEVPVRDSYEEHYRSGLTKKFQEIRQEIEDDIPKNAEQILLGFLL